MLAFLAMCQTKKKLLRTEYISSMAGEFFTIDKGGRSEFKEKGSKFLGFTFPVKNEEDVKQRQSELRKTYYDARHHCFAYVLGMEDQAERANDDGEPNHSAGDPILGQIHSYNLTNTLIVVVRYFGGTKLGVGGLVMAYKTAAKEAIEASQIKEIFPMMNVEMKFPYSNLGFLERQLAELEADVTERDFRETCVIQFKLKKANFQNLSKAIIDYPQIEITDAED